MTKTKLQIRILSVLTRDESGAALVETALSVSFLLAILLGAVEFGRVAYAGIVVSNAAHAAAQYAAQGTAYVADCDNTSAQSGGIQIAAKNEAGWVYSQNTGSFLTTANLSYICSDGTAATGLNTDCSTSQIERIISVTTTVSFQPLIHVPGTPTTYNLTGGATQKVMPN
jgi:Flp pilus assembly protein TadG